VTRSVIALHGTWKRIALAFAAGALAVPGFAPLGLWPLVIVSLTALFWLWSSASQAGQHAGHPAAIGFAWGMGLFGAGVPWLYISLHTYGGMPAAMAAFAVFMFCAYLSLFPMLTGLVQARLHRRLHQRGQASDALHWFLLVPALFVTTEMLRASFMSGFPWLVVGYSQTPGMLGAAPLASLAPVTGVFGISLVLAMTAGAVVWVLGGAAMRGLRAGQAAGTLALIGVAAALLSQVSWSSPSGPALPVSLAQGNVPQSLKFRADALAPTIDNYLELVAQSRGRLVVLPETAIPLLLENFPPELIGAIRQQGIARNGHVLLGAAWREPTPLGAYAYANYNGAISLGANASERYAKSHLVAFGEFVPPFFSWAFQWLSIPMSGFTPGEVVQQPMTLAGVPVAVNICYEDAFGRGIAAPLAAHPEVALLANLTNMAWFGESWAADQHAQMSQMRALETSRWMLRATNTGVTAAIDHRGRIVAALPQWTRGVLEVDAQPLSGATPYSRWRDWPIGSVLLAVFVLLFARRRREKP
jgi:apolipoprotein N-acyltransferase